MSSRLAYVRTFHEDWPEPIEGAEQGEVDYALTKADRSGRKQQSRTLAG